MDMSACNLCGKSVKGRNPIKCNLCLTKKSSKMQLPKELFKWSKECYQTKMNKLYFDLYK